MHRALVLLSALLSLQGCAVLYPRYSTALRPVPQALLQGGLTIPPDFAQRLSVASAEIPRTTRDGRPWDGENDGPDVYVVLFRNDQEVFRTSVQRNNLRPEWNSEGEHIDLHVRESDRLRWEIRDEDPVLAESIGVVETRGVPASARNGGAWTVRIDGGAVLYLRAVPPSPQMGMGITYEYHNDFLLVLDCEEAGPAFSAGIRNGDRITAINGRPISSRSEIEARQDMDRGSMSDQTLLVVRNNNPQEIVVRRDAVYPLH